MDLAQARAAVPGILRSSSLGELVTFRPMVEGKMSKGQPDGGRAIMSDVPARYDLIPDVEQIGGGSSRPDIARVMGEVATVSAERVRLAYMPRQGDHVVRVNSQSGQTETFRIGRVGETVPGIVLFWLSRV